MSTQAGFQTETADGHELFKQGQYAAARGYFAQAVQRQPSNVEAWFYLGVCEFRCKEFAASEGSFREAVRLDQNRYLAHYYLGLSLERQGKLEAAGDEYRATLRLKPDFAKAREKLGLGHFAATPPRPAPEVDVSGGMREDRARHGPTSGDESRSGSITEAKGELLFETNARMRSFGAHWLLSVTAAAIFCLSVLGANMVSNRMDGQFLVLVAFLSFVVFVLLLLALFVRAKHKRYRIYESLLDIRSGVFFRKNVSVWVYQLEDLWITRGPLELLTGDATLHLYAPHLETAGKQGGRFKIKGLGKARFVQSFFTQLREDAFAERREIKKWWV